MFQKQGASALRLGLDNIVAILEGVDNPHQKFKSIHVAGTNGKGSVCSYSASVLQEAGYSVGLFTSPHLEDYRERIRINGVMIPEQAVLEFMNVYYGKIEKLNASFFEVTTAMAFWWFAKCEVDIVVVETGMGGRLDCTNVLTPEVSVITKIGFDHQQYLGNTLAAIAKEKAGIIKRHVPVVYWETSEKVCQVIQETALDQTSKEIAVNGSMDVSGLPQILRQNLKMVQETIHVLQSKGWNISDENWENGIKHVSGNTGMHGRWEKLNEVPLVIADVAHNEDGIIHVVHELNKLEKKVRFVFGMGADKDIEAVLNHLPKDAEYYFTQANTSRALTANELFQKANRLNLIGKGFSAVEEAAKKALNDLQTNEILFVGGSFFVVGEFLNYWKSEGKKILEKKV